MADFDFTITERIAVLNTGGNTNITVELNKVKFGEYPEKLDLRRWRNGRPLKGLSLTNDEARNLLNALNQMNLD